MLKLPYFHPNSKLAVIAVTPRWSTASSSQKLPITKTALAGKQQHFFRKYFALQSALAPFLRHLASRDLLCPAPRRTSVSCKQSTARSRSLADRKYDHKLIPNVKCGKFGIGRVVTLDEFGRVQQCTICFRCFAFRIPACFTRWCCSLARLVHVKGLRQVRTSVLLYGCCVPGRL